MKFACFSTFSIAWAVMPAAYVLAQQHATRDRTVKKSAPNTSKTTAPGNTGAVAQPLQVSTARRCIRSRNDNFPGLKK